MPDVVVYCQPLDRDLGPSESRGQCVRCGQTVRITRRQLKFAIVHDASAVCTNCPGEDEQWSMEVYFLPRDLRERSPDAAEVVVTENYR